jgi:hypothetical protein
MQNGPFHNRSPLPFLVASPRPRLLPLPPPKATTINSVAASFPLLPISRKFSPRQLLSPDITVPFYHCWQTSLTSYRPQRTPALDRSYPLRGKPCEISEASLDRILNRRGQTERMNEEGNQQERRSSKTADGEDGRTDARHRDLISQSKDRCIPPSRPIASKLSVAIEHHKMIGRAATVQRSSVTYCVICTRTAFSISGWIE